MTRQAEPAVPPRGLPERRQCCLEGSSAVLFSEHVLMTQSSPVQNSPFGLNRRGGDIGYELTDLEFAF